jgi:cytochrome c
MRKRTLGRLLGFLIVVSGASTQALAADAEAGKAAFAKCGICHQVGPNAQIVVGPPLTGVVGRKAASLEGFAYSPGMKKLGDDGYVWDEEHLNAWIANPKTLLPASPMALAFQGIPDV